MPVKSVEPPQEVDVLIVGAGFAGTATAFHLSRQSSGRLLVVEQERIPGFHASGRNASLLLQSTLPKEVRRLTIASRKAYSEIAEQILYQPVGSLQLGKTEDLEPLRDQDLKTVFLSAAEVRQKVQLLAGHNFPAGLFTPSDGTIDIARLIGFYIENSRSVGVQFLYDCRVTKIEKKNGLFTVHLGDRIVRTRVLVNSAGAWANTIARLAGAAQLPLVPFKRHLFLLEPGVHLESSAPFVWSVEKNFYFRPESGSLLFSICDEVRHSDLNLEPTVNISVSEDLAELIYDELPALRDAEQRRVWACFRTKTPDDHPLIGWDCGLEGFFWVAGLGGHGMGASWEIGRVAAQSIRENSERHAFQPTRFQSH